MKNNKQPIYSFLALVTIIFGIFFSMMPQNDTDLKAPLSQFSTQRALEKVKAITKEPHYIGSKNHEVVAQYLQKELLHLGLETSLQEGFTLSDWGNLVKSKNILARIKGTNKNSKALLLLSHYDSAPHSLSKGASDDASGLATILESLRTFLYNKTKHQNDIIILFSDAEEIGLNGAALFVTQHQWAKEIGLALNFEARGSSGPSYMLMETNQGNANMVKAFSDANVRHPVSNSLMYSIYKMLPNDTDLTVFREEGKIQGYNFAFIDNHFNYHTQQDAYENLNPKTLTHQGAYLMPLLNHFANADLSHLNATADEVYFNIPFAFISYSFSYIVPMLFLAIALLMAFVFIGLRKQNLQIKAIFKGFIPFLGALITAGLVAYFGWKTLLQIYPQYQDILQGFTYNGHAYIYAFISLTLAICFLFYQKIDVSKPNYNPMIAPLLIWIFINIAVALLLKGASFLIIPVLSSTLLLGYFAFTKKSNPVLNIILAIPTLILLAPLIQMFPIGLGLKILSGSAILTVLSFTLLLPIFGAFTHKKRWALGFALVGFAFFAKAHFTANYATSKAKPNSLLYVFNVDKNVAYFTTYDKNLDEWTKTSLGNSPQNAQELNKNKLFSKYGSQFTFINNAPIINLEKPSINFLLDTVIGLERHLKISISPNRQVNRYDIFANEQLQIKDLTANGAKLIGQQSAVYPRKRQKILSYYAVDQVPLVLEFSIAKNQVLEMSLMESAFDLLQNKALHVPARKNWMMPTPFVLNDATVIEQQIKP
jgi:hypothetical protein